MYVYRTKECCKDKSRYNRVLIIMRYFIRFRAARILDSSLCNMRDFFYVISPSIIRRRFKPATALRRSYFAKMYATCRNISLSFPKVLVEAKLSACLTNAGTAQLSKSLWRSQLLLAAEAEAGGR